LRCIFSSGIAADVDNLPRNTGFFWRTLDGWIFSFEHQNSWQLWMFFQSRSVEKNVNLGKKKCVANKKSLEIFREAFLFSSYQLRMFDSSGIAKNPAKLKSYL